jgi:hypothetical protein
VNRVHAGLFHWCVDRLVSEGSRRGYIEAMETGHVLRAGRIDNVAVEEGQQVTQGALIALIGDGGQGKGANRA